LCTGSVDQRIVFEAWKRGVLSGRVPGLREHYRHKKTVMQDAMQAEMRGLLTWRDPRGGFFIWAALPDHLNGDTLLQAALSERVVYVAGAAFYVDGSGQNMIRLSFSAPGPDRIVEGIARLARVVRSAAGAAPSGS
jgi:DNA-binding transcriptional MocR family regulator